MTIAGQLKQTRDALAANQQLGGRVVIASDPYHATFILQRAPGVVQSCVMFHSERKRGEYEESGFVDRVFWVIVSAGKGLKLEPGAALTEGSAGGKPTFDLVELARQTLRALSFDPDTTEETPDYKGAEPFVMDGFLTDAYRLEFWIGCQLPAIVPPEGSVPDEQEVPA